MTCTPDRHVHKLGTAGCECGAIPWDGSPVQLAHVPMGAQAGADPAENPRFDGERIRPYDDGEAA